MKIKTVCDLTGLTDRTIRYYIEEKLISPSYTENYLGRKSFDFSQSDAEELKNISVLRKFEFTIEEIKDIANDAENSKAVIQKVKARTDQAVSAGQIRQRTLSQIEDNKAYSVAELAEELSIASSALSKKDEKIKKNIGKSILDGIKASMSFLVVWLPVVIQVLIFLITINHYAYPIFYPKAIVYMVLSVLPSLFILLLGKIKNSWKRMAKIVMMVLCAVSLLCGFVVFSFFPVGTFALSETTDFFDYRDIDTDCLANRDGFFNELFPAWPHYFENIKNENGEWETVYLDAHYYYRYLSFMDYTYDIFAEWPLEREAFDKEVSRVQALFESQATQGNRKYEIIQKGNYTCLVSYNGDPPFEAVTNSYTYYIFACDEANLVVRYILCDSLENGADQPFYLTLDW